MFLALDPRETFRLSLAPDKLYAEPGEPCLLFHWLSFADWRRFAALGDQPDALKGLSDEQAVARLFDTLRTALTGWENVADANGQPIPSDPAQLETILTEFEAWRVYWRARTAMRLGPEAKKNSEPPSPSASDSSATASAAPVATAPAPPSPSLSNVPTAKDTAAPTA